ncbi:Hypothetical predicted protein [Podarcis lilfordi]|uniref:Uncharacterized protein n=1 Tax=Podarcis lilfordi TaxID=74358 RepID=A0AA35K097_9SAUR|nr:Hypothetical predicted protein [Podarcis lilfordi]
MGGSDREYGSGHSQAYDSAGFPGCEELFQGWREKIKFALSQNPPPRPPLPLRPLFQRTTKAPRTSLPPQVKEKESHPEDDIILEDLEAEQGQDSFDTDTTSHRT